MNIFLQAMPPDNSIFDATTDVLFFLAVAFGLATAFWYFYQKKDQDTIERLQKDLDKIQPQHDVLQNQHEHLKAEHVKVKQGLVDLMDNYNDLNTKHEAFITAKNNSQKVTEQVDEERQMLLNSYESMELNFNALDTKYNDAITILDRLEEEIGNIKDERNELELVNSHLRKEISKLSNILEEKGENIETVRSDYNSDSTTEDDEIERLIGASKANQFSASKNDELIEVTVNNNETIITDLQAIYDALKEDYNQLRNEHTQLNNQYIVLQETHNQLIKSKDEEKIMEVPTAIKEEFKSLQGEYFQLQESYIILKDELENKVLPKLRATQTLLNSKEENYRQLALKMENQRSAIKNSSSQLKSFEDVRATNHALYTSNKNLTGKNAALGKKHESLKADYASLHSQFQLLREQFSLLEEKLETAQGQTNNNQFDALSKEYSSLKIEFLTAADIQKQQKANIYKLKELLKAINESSGYGIIYLPSNLQVIEGIGPKVESLLNKSGIHTWMDLAKIKPKQLENILMDGGKSFQIIDSSTWPIQAELLAKAKWKAFRDYEAALIGGKKGNNKQQEFDDLKIIEGIGPKIEVLLNNANICTLKKLSKTGIGELKRILKEAGSRYQIHDPSSWPEQAALAATLNWTALEKLKKELKGGSVQA